MNHIRFESAREKEKIRQDLRDVREQMLEKAKKSAEQREHREAQKLLSGETNWMLPAVSAKIDKLNKKTTATKPKKKKDKIGKKTKKSKKKKKKLESNSDSDSDADSSTHKRKHKKSTKKSKKKRARKYSESSSDSSASSDSEAPQRKAKKRRSSDSESSTGSDTWVEEGTKNATVPTVEPVQRDSWMTDALMLKTFSREKIEKKPNEKQQIDKYDPAQSSRELNPYWKTTGTGLPTSFRKPREDSDQEDVVQYRKEEKRAASFSVGTRNWQKRTVSPSRRQQNKTKRSPSSATSEATSSAPSSENEEGNARNAETKVADFKESGAVHFLTDQQMNELGAKIVKAEILGNTELALELKEKLENARSNRQIVKERKIDATKEGMPKSEEHVLLTKTDAMGNCRPLQQTKSINPNDLYGGRSGRKKQKHKSVETHEGGERMRFFADDDKYDIKQMFEREKYTSAADSNLQFANIASKHKNPNDDLEDIFADKIRKNISQEETDKKELSRAIHEQQKLTAKLETCDKCFDSVKMDKKLIVSMGEKVYLALPWYVGLQPGHCVLVPNQHASCCTQLDEDTWEDIMNFRKALTKMFAAQKKDVIFFEIANKLHKKPHLSIHCVPIRDKDAELAPFYFKKAIEESEHEWSVNKQLVSLRNKGLRSSIPKGLPYFWVNFGMQSGFAHVIEDQDRFPSNFAQEIIGGLLHLDPSKWRRPQKEQNIIAKVKMLADSWKSYDCTE